MTRDETGELAERIAGPLVRRYSTATVLYHHAVAEALGLGPSDHKCLDLLLERGPMTGSRLAAITGLTTGAVTGVVRRLERAGYVRRDPDPDDRRKQRLVPVPEGVAAARHVFEGLQAASDALLAGFDAGQLAVIAEFLDRATAYAYDRIATLRRGVLDGTAATGATSRNAAGGSDGTDRSTTTDRR
jgi:DNA-binding MarR family transcriptional regulator